MKIYLAIEVAGQIGIYNNQDELGGLIDNGIEHTIIGRVCDDKVFGDRCNTDCLAYAKGICPADHVVDCAGIHWNVIKY